MRMTLDETWKNCLSMWRWIAKEVRNGRKFHSGMKGMWMKEHGFYDYEAGAHCFFCCYKQSHNHPYIAEEECPGCPGSLVDISFDCMSLDYSYDEHPIAFYKELVSLNRKRLKSKK